MIGDNFIGVQKQSTAMRFKNVEAYETYINNIDTDYDAVDSNFTG